MKITYEIEIEQKDKNQNTIKKQTIEGHSFLAQFIGIIKGLMAHQYNVDNNGNVTIKDVTGTDRTYPHSYAYVWDAMSALGPAGNDVYGIQVGTSSTANLPTQYSLISKLPHGTGSGKIYYRDSEVKNPTNPTGGEWIFQISRSFVNDSGATLYIREVGIVVTGFCTGGVAYYFCIARDVISEVALLDGQVLVVRYKIKVVVS